VCIIQFSRCKPNVDQQKGYQLDAAEHKREIRPTGLMKRMHGFWRSSVTGSPHDTYYKLQTKGDKNNGCSGLLRRKRFIHNIGVMQFHYTIIRLSIKLFPEVRSTQLNSTSILILYAAILGIRITILLCKSLIDYPANLPTA